MAPGSISTFVIVTTEAAPQIADIHHRQPVILDDDAMEVWLEPGTAHDVLIQTAHRGNDAAYERRPVTHRVNDPLNDGLELLAPVMSAQPLPAAPAMA